MNYLHIIWLKNRRVNFLTFEIYFLSNFQILTTCSIINYSHYAIQKSQLLRGEKWIVRRARVYLEERKGREDKEYSIYF